MLFQRLGSLTAVLLFTVGRSALGAQISQSESQSVDVVTVTATRIPMSSYNVPAAISTVPASQLRNDALGVNLADDIGTVPGLLARNRNNYAQDQQISIRGFGANSTFGIRGVRVYQDGLPATGPDGQGQVSQFNLDSAGRVEILRGPFSALYGNSSGGVIQIFTADGSGPPQLRTGFLYGSFGELRANANFSGAQGPLAYNLDYTHFSIAGFRPHSSAKNESFNAKIGLAVNDSSKLTLVTNVIARPDAMDPLGLTPAQFAADTNSTDPAATQFNTRKSLQQQQGGLIYDLAISEAQSLRVSGYLGHRIVEHRGEWQGFVSYIVRLPEDQLSVVVFANLADANVVKIAREVAAIYNPELASPTKANE